MLNFSKCEFWLDNVTFLGHIVSKEGIFVDPKKVDVVLHGKDPQMLRKLKIAWVGRLLSMICGRIFYDCFPIIEVNKKAYYIFEWIVKCEQAFQELKHRLTTVPVIALPSGTENFVIYNDASRRGSSYVLCFSIIEIA